jgi:hypothetical protein
VKCLVGRQRHVNPVAESMSQVSLLLGQPVCIGSSQRQPVDGLELLDLGEDRRAERRLAFEGVQHDALNQITQRQVQVFGQGLQDLQRVPFDADPRSICTMVTWYHLDDPRDDRWGV